jgi:uridine phosphorylase
MIFGDIAHCRQTIFCPSSAVGSNASIAIPLEEMAQIGTETLKLYREGSIVRT